MPMNFRPSRRATAPVVPVPKKRIQDHVAGLAGRQDHPVQQRLGFWVGCAFEPVSSFSRSSPVHSGSVQSERICSSSLAIFMAS